jgi:hypothetical protein
MSDEANELSPPETMDETAKIQQMLAAVRQNARSQLPVPSVTGLLVGGDEGELQVATRTGIVGVPTDKILRTVHPISSRADIATFYLSDLDNIRSIFPVQPIDRAEGGFDSPVAVLAYASTSTSTAEAGESMTADPIAGVNSDDCEVHYSADDSLD